MDLGKDDGLSRKQENLVRTSEKSGKTSESLENEWIHKIEQIYLKRTKN